MIDTDTYALVPFADLDSFKRTYENLANYARRNGYEEFECDDPLDRIVILILIKEDVPILEYIAFGQSLPDEDGEDANMFPLAQFKKNNPVPLVSMIPVDITLCEDEYEEAVCVFRI